MNLGCGSGRSCVLDLGLLNHLVTLSASISAGRFVHIGSLPAGS